MHVPRQASLCSTVLHDVIQAGLCHVLHIHYIRYFSQFVSCRYQLRTTLN